MRCKCPLELRVNLSSPFVSSLSLKTLPLATRLKSLPLLSVKEIIGAELETVKLPLIVVTPAMLTLSKFV